MACLQFVCPRLQVVVLGANDFCSPVSGAVDSTCKNGGTCVKSAGMDSNNICRCVPGVRGPDCGIAPITFQTLDYSERPSVSTGSSGVIHISLDIATVRQGALVLYAVGGSAGSAGSAFVSVELVDGRPRASYRLTDKTVARVTSSRSVNNGLWHHVEVKLYAQVRMTGVN